MFIIKVFRLLAAERFVCGTEVHCPSAQRERRLERVCKQKRLTEETLHFVQGNPAGRGREAASFDAKA